jgi:cytochrome c5
VASTKNTEAQWAEFVTARAAAVSEREKATLVAYLSVNMPAASAAAKGGSAPVVAAALPRDGRELAWQQCQFCHSLFSSHLTQSRDVQGWRNMFLSPFHRELKMTPSEREEFARYSAINMPLKIEDVPSELRF